MSRLSMQLDPVVLQNLRSAAQRDGTTVQAVVRELLVHYTSSRMNALDLHLCQPERASQSLAQRLSHN
jgi:hypothetical protein